MKRIEKNFVEKDKLDIDKLTNRFFDLFTNKEDRIPNVADIKKLFIKEGVIINNTSGQPLVYGLQDFIAPREKILKDGTLMEFSEYETSHKTDVFQNIAQRFCRYKKSGILNGEFFESEGMKAIQFIKIDTQWKMVSVIWSDTD